MPPAKPPQFKSNVVIRFAGDSGDGIQLTGTQFTSVAALAGNDIATFPDFPAEIRAPAGTLAGVSGFQLNFGSQDVHTPGDQVDVLVVMNAAALKASLSMLKPGGIIIANEDGFDAKNRRLAGYPDEENPLENNSLSEFLVHKIPVTRLTRTALKGTELAVREIDRCKNMFILGVLYFMYNRSPETTIASIQARFGKKQPAIAEANITVLKAGHAFGETIELQSGRYEVRPAPLNKGVYRSIMGNQATALGLIAASERSGLPLYYASYPITPASDILHELSRHKQFGIITNQAEDEIASVASAIGAAFGGSLAATASAGPGIALKTEAIGLAVIYELPLVICNVQRAGPSTGMPTKMEQSDLLQAMYGRSGEAPVPIVAPATPSDCFDMVLEACRLAVEFMTPVFFLSDGYLANGAEPWRFPSAADLPTIKPGFAAAASGDKPFLAYQRDDRLVRPWAIPGTPGLEHRIGGLEKQDLTGNVSYDPANHERMVRLRQDKIDGIARFIPAQKVDAGPESGELAVVSWGSTYGAVKTALQQLREEGVDVAHIHLRHLHPFPANLGDLLKGYRSILVPETNLGQLVRLLRDRYLVPAIAYTKVQGQPFAVAEIRNRVWELLKSAQPSAR
ncbi:MAG: 2-oxoacid:acceptor oxidoreductase subunit alpha [Puniceicoccaceae bacterium]|nr:MAG: 2-oxoacid:acceptor oxidoreductase subunit alpha [Puniceicoccaceae bacterium]